jgi:hypothetical protein
MVQSTRIRWRGAAAAVAATGLALTMATGALAQDNATPEAGTPPNTEQPGVATSPNTGATASEKTQLTEAIQNLTDVIALVQADRDAAASKIDVAEIDALLAKATELRNAAQATLGTDDLSTAPRSVIAGTQTALAAQALIEAQLSAYGLPSQQGPASHVLVEAYYAIGEATAPVTANADPNAGYFTEAAQRLYTAAYEQYNAGTYDQARQTAQVALQLAQIGSILNSDLTVMEGGLKNERIEVAPGAVIQGEGPDAGLPPHASGMPEFRLPAIEKGGPESIEIHGGEVHGGEEFGGEGMAIPANGKAIFSTELADQSVLDVPEPNFE